LFFTNRGFFEIEDRRAVGDDFYRGASRRQGEGREKRGTSEGE